MSYKYRSDSVRQPTYSYHDQSLFPTPETLPTITAKRQRFRLLRTLIQIGFVLLPFVGMWILTSHYAATYNSYQQGSCTITAQDVNEVDTEDKHGHITNRTYFPLLSYNVQTANGAGASAISYDGPTAQGYFSYADAQAIVDKYHIGQVVQCRYNPVAPEKAFIIFYGFTSVDSAMVSFWGFCDIGAFALIIYLLFDWTVWRFFSLGKRGVATQGTVTDIKERRSRYGKISYTSIISFQVLEEPGRMRTISANSDLGVGTIQPVSYDPIFPRYRRYGEGLPNSIGLGIASIVLLTIIGLAILATVWFIP